MSIAAMDISLPSSDNRTISLQLDDGEVKVPIEYAECSVTLRNLRAGSGITETLIVPHVTRATWALIEAFIKEACTLFDNRDELMIPKTVSFPEYDFETLYVERLSFIGKIQHLPSLEFIALLKAVNFLDIPFLYRNLLTYCNLQTLSIEDFGMLPRVVQGDFTAKLKMTRISKKNNVAFKGHTDRITATYVDTDNQLFSQSDDYTLRIWDIGTSEPRAVCKGHTSSLICFFVNEDKIISASYDNTVRVWNKRTGVHRGTCQHARKISAMCVNGTKIFIASGTELSIWDQDTQALLHTCNGQTRDVKKLCANEQYVMAGFDDGIIRLWNSDTGEPGPVIKGHTGSITALAFFGKSIISSSEDKTVRIWNPELQESTILLKTPKPILSITLAHNKLVLQSKRNIYIYAVPDVELMMGRPHTNIAHLTIECEDLMQISVGSTFIIGATRQMGCPIFVWDISSGIQRGFCDTSSSVTAGWPSVCYDDAHNTIFMENHYVLYACDLSIFTHLRNLTTEQAKKILSYLKGKTTYEEKEYKTLKLMNDLSDRSTRPLFRDVVAKYFKESATYDWNEVNNFFMESDLITPIADR